MYLNFDELPDEQTLAASLAPLKLFRDEGLRADLAVQDDVNGIAWCFSEYFADAGVKYLNMGTHGHRALICFDKPTVFWWESPSGKKILAYRAEHYHLGNYWGVHNLMISQSSSNACGIIWDNWKLRDTRTTFVPFSIPGI